MPLAAPIAARAADPLVEDAPAVELHAVLELRHQVGQLGIAFLRAQLVRYLERDGSRHAWIVRERRFGHEDLVIPLGEPLDDFVRRFLAWEVQEELLDVLDSRAPAEAMLIRYQRNLISFSSRSRKAGFPRMPLKVRGDVRLGGQGRSDARRRSAADRAMREPSSLSALASTASPSPGVRNPRAAPCSPNRGRLAPPNCPPPWPSRDSSNA